MRTVPRGAIQLRTTDSEEERHHGAIGKSTLSEASRARLRKPVLDPEMRKEYEEITGEKLEEGDELHWAEYIAATGAHRAATSKAGARDAKELREASERPTGEKTGKAAFLLGMTGLPRTNAVTGFAPEEMDSGGGLRP